MPPTSPALALLEKANQKANSKPGLFSSSKTTKLKKAGALYQDAANAFKLNKQFKEAGDALVREAECREKCMETKEAKVAWFNAARAYKQSDHYDCETLPVQPFHLSDLSCSGHSGAEPSNYSLQY